VHRRAAHDSAHKESSAEEAVMEAGDLIAIALAVVALLNLGLAWQRDRRRIRINCSLRHLVDTTGCGSPLVCLDVVNAGHRPVVVSEPVLQTQDGCILPVAPLPGTDSFPKRLGDGETASVRLPLDGVAAALLQAGIGDEVKLVPVCTDGVGNTYRGAPWQLNLGDALARSARAGVVRLALERD
jgi:hypothetical protein